MVRKQQFLLQKQKMFIKIKTFLRGIYNIHDINVRIKTAKLKITKYLWSSFYYNILMHLKQGQTNLVVVFQHNK